MTVPTIIKQLESTASRLEKEAILEANRNDADLKEFFRLCLEPKVNFFIKKIPQYKMVGETLSLSTAMDILSKLSDRTYTGHKGILYLTSIFEMLPERDAKMLERIINKNPGCGVSVSTVNKIWPNLVTDVPYMRASLIKSSNYSKIDWSKGVYSQTKEDGMFASVNVSENGLVSISSRNGTPFPMDQFQGIANLAVYCGMHNQQMHGEILVKKDDKFLPREKSNGILNSVLHGEAIPEGHRAVYVVWDAIPIDKAVAKGKYRVPYSERFSMLQYKFQSMDDSIVLVDTAIVYSPEEAMMHYQEKLNAGLEGTVIKTHDMIWEDTTSKNMIKVKMEVSCELEIIGFNDAADTSKNKHLFGSMLLASSDRLLEVSATGFTDKERKEINDNKDFLIGKIVQVCSNNIMKPSKQGGKYSLFLPRYQGMREDKNQADSLQRIIDQFESAVKI